MYVLSCTCRVENDWEEDYGSGVYHEVLCYSQIEEDLIRLKDKFESEEKRLTESVISKFRKEWAATHPKVQKRNFGFETLPLVPYVKSEADCEKALKILKLREEIKERNAKRQAAFEKANLDYSLAYHTAMREYFHDIPARWWRPLLPDGTVEGYIEYSVGKVIPISDFMTEESNNG